MGKSLHYSQLRWQWFECLDASWRHVEGRFGSKDRISHHPPKTKWHPSMLNICLINPDGIVIRLRWNVLHIWTSDEWRPVHQSRGVPVANPTTEKNCFVCYYHGTPSTAQGILIPNITSRWWTECCDRHLRHMSPEPLQSSSCRVVNPHLFESIAACSTVQGGMP